MSMKIDRFNPKRDGPYLGAIAQAAQFVLAGYILFGWLGIPFALLLGLLVSISVAYAASQYADAAKSRQPYIMAGMIFIMALSPSVVGVSVTLHIIESHPALWLGWAVLVGVSWAIIPDVSVMLIGFTAGKGMAAQDRPQTSDGESQGAKKGAKAAKTERIACPHEGAGCDRKFAVSDYKSRKDAVNAANGHSKSCAYKPTIIDVGVR
jgi:hypothetical protein